MTRLPQNSRARLLIIASGPYMPLAHALSVVLLLRGRVAPYSAMNRSLHPQLLLQAARALKKVLVTGAGGRTGKLVFEQLKADDNYKPVGLARSSKAQKALTAVGATTDEVIVADVADESALAAAMAGCDAVVLCTSAVPAIKPLSLMKTMATKVLPFVKTSRPAFKFPQKWHAGGGRLARREETNRCGKNRWCEAVCVRVVDGRYESR